MLAGVLLAVTVTRIETTAAGAWMKFGTIDVLVGCTAVVAIAATLPASSRSFSGRPFNNTRVLGIVAVGTLVLTIVRMLLSAVGVGLPVGTVSVGSIWDEFTVLVGAGALAGVSALAFVGGPVPRLDVSAPRARATGAWAELRRRHGAAALWTLGLIFVAGLFVSFYKIGTPSWIFDEIFYRTAGLAYVAHGDFAINREHVFLAKDLFGAMQLLFGSGPTAVRLPSALAGLLTGAALFAFGRHAAGLLAGTTSFAAWTLLPHPIYSDYGNVAVIKIERYALLDPVMVMFLVIALGSGWRWIQTQDWRWALWFGAASGLSTASKVTAACVLPGLLLCGVLMVPDRRKALWQAATIVAIVVLVVLLSYLPPLGDSPSAFVDMLHFQRLHTSLGHLVVIGGHLYRRAPWWAHLWWEWHSVGPITTAVLVVCAITAPFYIGWRLGVYLWVAVAVPLVYLSLFVGFGLPHYYIIWQAPLTLLAALGWSSLWRAGVTARLASAAMAIPIGVVMLATIMNVASLRPNDYAAAGQLLRRDGLGQARVAVWWATPLLTPYLPQARVSTEPEPGHSLDAIVVDPNYSLTIANRALQFELFFSRRNFESCQVDRLTVYIRVLPRAEHRATRIC